MGIECGVVDRGVIEMLETKVEGREVVWNNEVTMVSVSLGRLISACDSTFVRCM